MSSRIPKTRREIAQEAERLPSEAELKMLRGNHNHTAELHGVEQCRALKRWATRRVMEYAR